MEEKTAGESKVTEIGSCPGCMRMAALREGSCKACFSTFGPKYGAMAKRIREDEGFRKKCYGALKSDLAKRQFVLTFGDPHAIGSTNMAEGSRR